MCSVPFFEHRKDARGKLVRTGPDYVHESRQTMNKCRKRSKVPIMLLCPLCGGRYRQRSTAMAPMGRRLDLECQAAVE